MLLKSSHTTLSQVLSPAFGGKTFVRLLILGEDNTNRSRVTGHGLSDTIMVAAIDLSNKTVKMVSVPRDSSVDIPGHGTRKINASFAIGGPEMTRQVVQSVLGIDGIDYYVKTDIAGLTNIVDMVGGVGLDVEKDMHYTDRRGHLYINLKKGYRHLNGEKSLGYVRFRHDRMGDITRTERQQKFLRALSRQLLLPQNWAKLPTILDEIRSKGYVETDMQPRDLLELARLARDVPQEKVVSETLPGGPIRIGRASMWQLDREKTAAIVQKLLDYPTAGSSAKVRILNGSGVAGLAKSVADKLEQSGFKVAATGNAGSFDYESCEVIVHNPQATGAENIAQMLGCSGVKNQPADASSGNADITVIVGRSYKP